MSQRLDNKITACLVVYNEGKTIKRCLESIKKVTNNIVVAHDGTCNDETLRICLSMGCSVVERNHIGMCEGHRVWTYFQVKTPWILQIDADEFLSDAFIRNCPSLVNSSGVACYEFLWPYWDGTAYKTHNWPYKKALFKKDRIQYIGFPHEEVRVNGIIKKVPFVIEHRPAYDNYSAKTFLSKHKKWIKIHARYYFIDQKQLDSYPKYNNEFAPHYSIVKSHPLLIAPVLFMYHLIGLLVYGGVKEGWYGVRNSFMQALYYFLLCIEVFKLRNEREHPKKVGKK
ncbi:MAG: glycosyltransferase [Candidatus Electrothrix sp. ATG2]|nr:glycosyltransferase [Candidatus Electrothrix sp. ATG2]